MIEAALSGRKYSVYPEYKESGVEWIGKIPKSWSLKKLKYLAPIVGEKAENKTNPIALENIESWTGKLIETKTEFEGVGVKFIAGDILFGKLRPYLAKVYRTEMAGEAIGDFHVMRPISDSYGRFLTNLMLTKDYISTVDASTYGAKMPRASWEFTSNIELPFCSSIEAVKIANFLDHETAKIDTLIAKQETLIALLKEKRQAVISHAVTKGLDQNSNLRKPPKCLPAEGWKDSGVEWLGEVPGHWKVQRFKFLCDNIIAGPFGSSITKDMYVKKGYKVYGQEQVIPNNFTLGDYYISEDNFNALSRYRAFSEDLLISCVGTFGKIAVFPKNAEEGIINPRLIKASIKRDNNPYFIREFLKSETVFKQFELLSRGGTMGVINIAILNEIFAVAPPKEEQNKIYSYLLIQKSKFKDLIEKCELQIKLLKERKTALISAAVTGKIDVRDWKLNNDQ